MDKNQQMKSESRTFKSIKNAKIALLFYFINLILNFYSRKVFLDYLGAEVLGLNTAVQNLLGFLNLAELGIGTAISYTLYRPIFDKDTEIINEIVSVQGWLYRKIAFWVIGGACILMCFFPIFFAKTSLPLWYAYAIFIVLLCSSLFSYFWNYRQIVLTADQKEYKVTINVQGFKIIKVLLQIVAIIYFTNGYVWWLALELLMSVVTVVILNKLLKSEYPWLKSQPSRGKSLKAKYPQIIRKTKQLFFHRIGGFVLTQSSPLIIYAYASLTLVAVYGNYMLIVTGVTLLLSAIFNGIGAGIGHLVAEGDRVRISSVLEELFSSRFLFTSTICFGVYFFAPSFITLWIGEQYLLDNITFLFILAIMYIRLMWTLISSFIDAYGLFQDIWAIVAETCLNVCFSILLGYYYGLHGILSGVLISQICIIFLWKPYFLFRNGLCCPIMKYIKLYMIHVIVGAVVFASIGYLMFRQGIPVFLSWTDLILSGSLYTGLFFLSEFFLLYFTAQGMRDFLKRVLGYIRK